MENVTSMQGLRTTTVAAVLAAMFLLGGAGVSWARAAGFPLTVVHAQGVHEGEGLISALPAGGWVVRYAIPRVRSGYVRVDRETAWRFARSVSPLLIISSPALLYDGSEFVGAGQPTGADRP